MVYVVFEHVRRISRSRTAKRPIGGSVTGPDISRRLPVFPPQGRKRQPCYTNLQLHPPKHGKEPSTMKKILTIILLTSTILLATACSSSVVSNAGEENEGQTMFERHKLDDGYSILVEKDTGVCYLEFDACNCYSITVLLNADGTPKIWED